MKKSMPEYMKVLSDDDYEIMEELFTEKYRKFTELYWLIRDFSDYITSLRYKKTKKDILKITMTLTKIDIDQVMGLIDEKIESNDHVSVWNEKKVIHIEIHKDESELP